MTFASLFTGGGGADVGAQNAGFELTWGLEYDPQIAEVANANSSSAVLRYAEEPAPTIANINRVGNRPRAWLEQDRVVAMTSRCLARFQTFPDSYVLPDKNALACKIIGNAVPCLMYEKIIKEFLSQLFNLLENL